MNTLEQLNNYSNELVAHEDERSFSITLLSAGGNEVVNINEGQSHALPVSLEVEVISFDIVGGDYITLTIDLTNSQAATVAWNAPVGIVTSEPSPGIHVADYIVNQEQINDLLLSTISGLDQGVDYDYTVTWSWTDTGPVSVEQTVTVQIVSEYGEISEPIDTTFIDNVEIHLSGVPQTTDAENSGNTYSIEVTASPDWAIDYFNSDSFTWNGSSLTITGDRNQVNAELSSIKFRVLDGYGYSLNLSYTQTNIESGLETTVDQLLTYTNDLSTPGQSYIQNHDLVRTYYKNTVNEIFDTNPPEIIENDPGTPEYIIKLEIGTGSLVAPTPAAGTVIDHGSFIEIVGTQSEVNAIMPTILYAPEVDDYANYTIVLTLFKDSEVVGGVDMSLTGINSEPSIPDEGVFVYTSDQVVNISYAQVHYLNCEILAIAGGGSGGSGKGNTGQAYTYVSVGGGGGAGELWNETNPAFISSLTPTVVDGSDIQIEVGAGGAAAVWNPALPAPSPPRAPVIGLQTVGNRGGNTTLTVLTNGSGYIDLEGGGYGGGPLQVFEKPNNNNQLGSGYGGSGGGVPSGTGSWYNPLVAPYYDYPVSYAADTIKNSGTQFHGHDGETVSSSTYFIRAGAGGGAYNDGLTDFVQTGYTSSITGSPVVYGTGGNPGHLAHTPADIGGGGHGGSHTSTTSGAGGDGIVILRFYR